MRTVALDEAVDLIYGDAEFDEDADFAIATQLNDHLLAGKGVAIYRNEDLGHPEIGHCMAFTFGTPQAQFEGDAQSLPDVLPDGLAKHITGGINWRYRLNAVVPRREET